MLAGKVHAPAHGELKLATVGNSLLKNLDTLGIGETHKGVGQHALQSVDECLVDHLVQELKVILTVVECPLNAILNEVFFKIHQVVHVDERHLWLYHPELCQVTGSVGVLCTERRTEGIDSTQGGGSQLSLQLATHSE